jgi:hypothetical protein
MRRLVAPSTNTTDKRETYLYPTHGALTSPTYPKYPPLHNMHIFFTSLATFHSAQEISLFFSTSDTPAFSGSCLQWVSLLVGYTVPGLSLTSPEISVSSSRLRWHDPRSFISSPHLRWRTPRSFPPQTAHSAPPFINWPLPERTNDTHLLRSAHTSVHRRSPALRSSDLVLTQMILSSLLWHCTRLTELDSFELTLSFHLF